jgi:hypothetical protein
VWCVWVAGFMVRRNVRKATNTLRMVLNGEVSGLPDSRDINVSYAMPNFVLPFKLC